MTREPRRPRIDDTPRSVLTRIRASIAATCAIAIGGVAALLVGVSSEVSAEAETGTSRSVGETSSSDTSSTDTSSSDTAPTAESSVSADGGDSQPVGGSNGS